MSVVERLDLKPFYEPIQARQGVAGRDATDPQLLVALWLYARTCGIGSARELARRTRESAPFQWLCGGVTVNHRLLSDFRTALGAAAGGAQTGGDRAVGAGRSTVAGTEAEAGGRAQRGSDKMPLPETNIAPRNTAEQRAIRQRGRLNRKKTSPAIAQKQEI